jgi:hypothetical protein
MRERKRYAADSADKDIPGMDFVILQVAPQFG